MILGSFLCQSITFTISGAIPAPEMHLWVKSRPDWCSILDDLPQHQADPGS